jgi:hypothetical protein
MNNLDYHVKAVVKVIGMIAVPLLIFNGIFYLLGSFIAMDWNVHDWWFFRNTFGRVFVSIIELLILATTPKFWDEIS